MQNNGISITMDIGVIQGAAMINAVLSPMKRHIDLHTRAEASFPAGSLYNQVDMLRFQIGHKSHRTKIYPQYRDRVAMKIPGDGVFTELLKSKGIKVMTELDFEETDLKQNLDTKGVVL